MGRKEESGIGLPDTLSRLGVPRTCDVLCGIAGGIVVSGAIGSYGVTETVFEAGRWSVLGARQSIRMLVAVVIGTEIKDSNVVMAVVSSYESLRAKCK